jgi:hypothetical protein
VSDIPKPSQIWDVYFPTSNIMDLKIRPVLIINYCENENICLIVPLSSTNTASDCCAVPLNPDDFDAPKPKIPLWIDFHKMHTLDRKLLNTKISQIKENVYSGIIDKFCAILKNK